MNCKQLRSRSNPSLDLTINLRNIVRYSFVFLIVASTSVAANTKELLLFGGAGNDKFLGCLNCDYSDSNSICNKYGMGSKYESNSIFNKYGDFGSKYSNYSPWNKYSNEGPVVVDKSGSYFGRFTINKYAPDRIDNQYFNSIADLFDRVGDIDVVHEIICGS